MLPSARSSEAAKVQRPQAASLCYIVLDTQIFTKFTSIELRYRSSRQADPLLIHRAIIGRNFGPATSRLKAQSCLLMP